MCLSGSTPRLWRKVVAYFVHREKDGDGALMACNEENGNIKVFSVRGNSIGARALLWGKDLCLCLQAP